MRNYLDFEKELKSLEDNLESSKNPFDKDGISEVDVKKSKRFKMKSMKNLKVFILILIAGKRQWSQDMKIDQEQIFMSIR